MDSFLLDGDVEAEKRIPLLIPANYFVVVNFTTQAAFEIEVDISDQEVEYFTSKRQSTEVLPIISNDFRLQSDKAVLGIRIPQSQRMDVRMNDMEIKSEDGTLISRTITLVAEDSYDYDYNDLLLTISAWKDQG